MCDLIEFWNSIFQANNILEELYKQEGFANLSRKVIDKFQLNFCPEPYYGYLNEDTSNDVLLLLLNPGQISEEGKDKQTIAERNRIVKERYTIPWKRNDYLHEEQLLKVISNWRDVRFKQVQGIVGQFGFLHTMEFFPFHSKHYPSQLTKPWVYNLQSTKLAFNAVKEIAVKRRVKHIFSIGRNWEVIFKKYKVPLTKEVILTKHGGKRFSFRFLRFQFTPESLPILICTLGSGAMSLPTDNFAITVAQNMLGLIDTGISQEHDTYKITVV